MPVMGQNITPLNQSAGKSMLEVLADDQVQILTSRLNLNEKQQAQVSALVLKSLKSAKFQKLLGVKGEGSLSNADSIGTQSEKIQNTLLLDKDFQKDMSSVLDDKQMETMKDYMPK
ncbi:hypothetical protein C1T31_03770 [Hanstruepera neustonica]|uniref:DUF4168 domain-containing protein n=2 Tax=Hanstruepera neustonica TaxID=1445657 RepID=A0A2K1E4R6_9FLAO|nr:hypothetical protein C1T31_03770 [Hanstruepera neustonica]